MRTRRNLIQPYLAVAILAGLLALVSYFSVQSSGERGFFLGFSASRLAAGLAVIGMLAGLSWVLWLSYRKHSAFEERVSRLVDWGQQRSRWLISAISIFYLAFAALAILLSFRSPFARDYAEYAPVFEYTLRHFETITAQVQNAWPLLTWVVFLLFLTAVFWAALFSGLARRPKAYRIGVILKTLLVLGMITLWMLHAIILAMQMTVFKAIPGWYWDIRAKPFTWRDGLFLLLMVVALVLIRYVLRSTGSTWRNLALLFVLGWLIQVGFGFIEGQGFESLRLKYASSLHRSHATKASADEIDILTTIRDYDELYGSAMFQSTKPPGTLVLYMLTRYLSDSIAPRATPEGRFESLTRLQAYLFPVISFLVLIVLYGISRTFLPARDRLLPAVLYILLPNVILLPLFLDQVLYPLLFISGTYILVILVDRQDFGLAVLAGGLLYLAAFFSFSMLPLIPFAFLYIAIDYWTRRPERRLLKSLGLYLGILVGFAVLFVVFAAALEYNAYSRYQGAMEVVRNFDFLLRVDARPDEQLPNTGFVLPLRYIASAFWLNNLEFASAIGFPVYLLFLIQGVMTLIALGRSKTAAGQALFTAYFATFFAMNIFAPIQGEAARLWIFWTPVMVLFAGSAISTIFKGNRNLISVLVILQLSIVYLTFKFQDLAP